MMRFAVNLLGLNLTLSVLTGQDSNGDAGVSPAEIPVEKATDQGENSADTTAFDSKTLEALFQQQQEENKRNAAELAPHMNADDLDMVVLAPVETEAFHIRNFDALLEELDPQPEQRMQRLAELDQKAAWDLQDSIRADERFFAGEDDLTFDRNAGRVATFGAGTLTSAISSTISKAKESRKKKSMMDDQKTIDLAPQE